VNTLRNTLFFSLALQVCIAAGIFAAAEEAPLALGTIPLAIGALLLIDFLGWLRPPAVLLNLAALASLGLAFVEFRQDGEARLLAGGHLVVYLTWTFLLQVKDLRRMWWMFALSVLQVAMGAVLTIQPWFGAALFVYTASAVWTMSLLSLTRAALLADPLMLTPGGKRGTNDEAISAPLTQFSSARNGVRTDEHGRWISPRFFGGGVITLVLILFVGMAFFFLTPRVWIGTLNGGANQSQRRAGATTGFADNIKLGDIGQIMESKELVMQVTVLNGQTEERIPPQGLAAAIGDDPLFRGAVLENYVAGTWTQGDHSDWLDSYFQPGPVQLNITLQPLSSSILFYPGFAVGARATGERDRMIYHPSTSGLESYDADQQLPFSYSVTLLPPDVIPDARRRRLVKDWIRQNGLPPELKNLLKTPTPRLTQRARDILARSAEDGDLDSEDTARELEEYLRDSNEFNYTLDLSVTDPKIDPVEDFVFNRKKGHCEYFASALALMLRGVGIPTRVIRGFKGAEYDPATGDLEVRDLHAHAWLEAFVDGGWITLDPTPGQRDTEVALKVKESAPDLVDKTRSIWFQGMNYSNSQQDQLVYAPLREIGNAIKLNFQGIMQGEIPLLAQLGSFFTSPNQWSSGLAIAMLLLFALSIWGSLWILRRVFKRWKGWTRSRDLAQRRAITVEFYARLMGLLHRFGLADVQTLTPREFAHRAEDQFLTRFQKSGIAGTTLQLVETFYAVRFGEQPLTAEQLQTVDRQLGELERSLVQPGT